MSTPASSASFGPVGEGEERVRGERGAFQRVAVLGRLLERDANGVDAAHLAGADADRLEILGQDDGVREDVLADPPGEEEVAPAGLVRRLARDDLHALAVVDLHVGVLREHASEQRGDSRAHRLTRVCARGLRGSEWMASA